MSNNEVNNVSNLAIFPPLGVARVGNAPEKFYISPDSFRGLPSNPDDSSWSQADLRDSEGRMARQAAQFQVFDCSDPANPVVLGIGSTVDGKQVTEISWVVHLANKKASWYEFQTSLGEQGYSPTHPLRNASVPAAERLTKLVIDAGPRQISASNPTQVVPFDASSTGLVGGYAGLNFPAGSVAHPAKLQPNEDSIDTLGELRMKADGSALWVLGGLGISGTTEAEAVIQEYANNDNWFDDTSDGPVKAIVTFDDTSSVELTGASVMVGPPSYAPEIPNLVTLYDTIFDAQVRAGMHPEICENGIWKSGPDGYLPNFELEIQHLIERGELYPWVAAIPPKPHTFDMTALGTPGQEYAGLRKYVLEALRAPNKENQIIGERGNTMMPYLAGDNCLKPDHMPSTYLRITDTQFFFLQQWAAGYFDTATAAVPVTEAITRGVLDNCVGGAFSPGIEMTWISRNMSIYAAPFRINGVFPDALSLGFDPDRMEPGDICRYMAIPWQADFNECSSQPIDGRVLWWWPSQRPEFVYEDPAEMIAEADRLPLGPGPDSGRQVAWVGQGFDQNGNGFISFSDDVQMVQYWSKLGFVLEKTVDNEQRFVEVERTLGPRPFYPPSS